MKAIASYLVSAMRLQKRVNMKKYSMAIVIALTGVVVASCNSGFDDGYGYDECYDEFDCGGPFYDMAGTSQFSASDVIQVNTVVGGTHEVNLVLQSRKLVKNLTLDNLTTLPSGWSNIGNVSCSSVNSENECIFTLQYRPTVLDSGNLRLRYSYVTESNTMQESAIALNFASTTSNNVNVTVVPMVEVPLNSSKLVKLSFNSDNGNLASDLHVTNGLADLTNTHSGWSAPTSFSCSDLINGQCILTLSYAPTRINDHGIIVLNYSYINDHNQTTQATATILYRATK
jgi:hypothetical protein